MSMPLSARGTQRRGAARLRPLALAAALTLGLGLTGCANYETLEPYQPAAGVVTDAPGMQVRNLMLVSDGTSMRLAGNLIAAEADSLKSVTGTALKTTGDKAGALTVKSAAVPLVANKGLNLFDKNITATGDVKPGGMAEVTLTFDKAAPITLQAPVVDAKALDISTTAPSATNS